MYCRSSGCAIARRPWCSRTSPASFGPARPEGGRLLLKEDAENRSADGRRATPPSLASVVHEPRRLGRGKQMQTGTEDPVTKVGSPAIVARRLTKRFGEVTAVDGRSVEAAAGQGSGFGGPDGGGRSGTLGGRAAA